MRANVERSGEIGQLVAGDFKSSIGHLVPLLDKNPKTGARRWTTGDLSRKLDAIRDKYESDTASMSHVVGFAKVAGDLIERPAARCWMFFGRGAADLRRR